jgi:hypothetical protein
MGADGIPDQTASFDLDQSGEYQRAIPTAPKASPAAEKGQKKGAS